jgi:hypothetical protein
MPTPETPENLSEVPAVPIQLVREEGPGGIVAASGEAATGRFFEYFTVNIRNRNTRRGTRMSIGIENRTLEGITTRALARC